jgi:hypothetical protein
MCSRASRIQGTGPADRTIAGLFEAFDRIMTRLTNLSRARAHTAHRRERSSATVITEGWVTTLEVSELGFEGPANEMAAERRAALPEILAFRLARVQALGHPQKREPTEAVVIDARHRFGRRIERI